MKTYLHTIIKSILLLVVSVLAGYLLLVAVYAIPMETTFGHVKSSAATLEEEGIPYFLLPEFESTFLDTYTDAVMLNTASYSQGGNPFQEAVLSRHYRYTGAEGDENIYQSFLSYTQGKEGAKPYGYALYWHGYLLFLKPLLFVGSLSTIRMLNTLAQLLLMGVLLLSLARAGGGKYIPAVLMAWFFLTPPTLFLSLQFSDVYYIAVIALIVLVRGYGRLREKNWFPYFFLLTGIATSYFDLLTYPVVTLGFPLVLLVVLESQEGRPGKKLLLETIVHSGFWSAGYLGMWAGKWILGSWITGTNVVEQALDEILYRTSPDAGGQVVSNWDVIRINVAIYERWIYYLAVLFFAVYIGYLIWRGRKVLLTGEAVRTCNYVVPLLLVACYPFAWYIVVANHSYIHNWMVHKELAIGVFAMTCMALRFTAAADGLPGSGGKAVKGQG